MSQQRTLKSPVAIEGVGLHTGEFARVIVRPAPADAGMVFVRTDRGGAEIPASHEHVVSTSLATTVSAHGVSVGTVEHLLAALFGLGVDNARIEIDGPEIPILDGSAAPFVDAVKAAGIVGQGARRRSLHLRRPVAVRHGERTVLALPSEDLRISYAIDFAHPAIGYQAVTLRLDEKVFAASIAPARTFCLLRDVNAMRDSGLALGGSLDNALVVGDDGPVNGELRFRDEFVRHKVLDLIGDLALAGAPLRAHVIVFKGGHRMHAALVQKIAERSRATAAVAPRLSPDTFERFAHFGRRLVPSPQVLTA
jgi:UDP-3-O-[3-hydroxymyristoyl] N-acetylglucosamine deacetylase